MKRLQLKASARKTMTKVRPFAASVLLTAGLLFSCGEQPAAPDSSPAISRSTPAEGYVLPSGRANPREEIDNDTEVRIVTPRSDYQFSMNLLRENGFSAAADVLEARVNQPEKKMKLQMGEATKIAKNVAEILPGLENCQKLLGAMPRSTVELVRATVERGVTFDEAERIADFMFQFTDHVQFRNLKQFDNNFSHVVGRDWPDIDYEGEGTTWQQRKQSWGRMGVEDFRTARSVCKYFRIESRMKYYRRIYRPQAHFPQKLDSFCE